MTISDLELVIENPSGTYKKFADTLDEYPILGVTYPTHYGFIKGYQSEDGHDLDVFIGNGELYGFLKVNRDDVPGGIETKFMLGISDSEKVKIEEQFMPVISELKILAQAEFFDALQPFQSDAKDRH